MKQQFAEMTTSEVFQSLEQKNSLLIDVRDTDQYNGWSHDGATRYGHIAGAKNLPARWTGYMDWIEMVRKKQIRPGQPLIIYGNNRGETVHVAAQFTKSDYQDVRVYHHFEDEWRPNEAYPMEHLKRFRNLVPAWWVNSLVHGRKPPHYDNDKFVIVHPHYRYRDAYLSGHIPGAIDMDTRTLEDMETWNRRSPGELKKALEEHGITADTTVILYGKFMFPDNADAFPGSASGHLGAMRIAFLMLYAGVRDVRVLNGGFQSWKDAGYEIAYNDEPKTPVSDFGASVPAKPELAVDTPEAKQMLQARDAELVSVRSYPEYIGEVSGYNYIEPKGRIPGSVFADCGTDAYHMENYRNFDHTTREFHEIEVIWKNSGITPNKHLAFYCGTGWRGSEAWFNAWLMGWPHVAVYDGGWFEWSNDPANPFETGEPAHLQKSY